MSTSQRHQTPPPVALKIPQGTLADEAARTQPLHEAQNASALTTRTLRPSTKLAKMAARFTSLGMVEGRPLKELVPLDGMAPETVIRYGIQIADAVAHAHERALSTAT